MLKDKIIFGVMLTSFLLPASVFAQDQEIRDYKVKAGDTLWDISGKELNDEFLWPKIWKENPEIKNPDLLHPGQMIRIPLYLIQKEKEEGAAKPAVKSEPVKAKVEAKKRGPEAEKLLPLVDKSILLASGYMADIVTSVGRVTGSPSGRNLFGNDDLIYVKTDLPVKTGDKFYIIRADKLVRHPETNKNVGYIVEIRGIAEIIRLEYGDSIAKITQVFGDVVAGDILDTFYELNPPLTTPLHRKPDINGIILAANDLRILNNNYDIVFIDKGEKDGVEIGDLLKTLSAGEHKYPNGIIQVINRSNTTSTAIVLKNSGPIEPGNLITKLE